MGVPANERASSADVEEEVASTDQGSFLRFLEDVERLRQSHRLATQIVRVLMDRDYAQIRELLAVCATALVPANVREEMYLFLRLPPWTARAPVKALLHQRRTHQLLAEAVREAVAYEAEVDTEPHLHKSTGAFPRRRVEMK